MTDPIHTLGAIMPPAGTRFTYQDGHIRLHAVPAQSRPEDVAGQLFRLITVLNHVLGPATLKHLVMAVPASAPQVRFPMAAFHAWPERSRLLLVSERRLWRGGTEAARIEASVEVKQITAGRLELEAYGRVEGVADEDASTSCLDTFPRLAAQCATSLAEILAQSPVWVVASGLQALGVTMSVPRPVLGGQSRSARRLLQARHGRCA